MILGNIDEAATIFILMTIICIKFLVLAINSFIEEGKLEKKTGSQMKIIKFILITLFLVTFISCDKSSNSATNNELGTKMNKIAEGLC